MTRYTGQLAITGLAVTIILVCAGIAGNSVYEWVRGPVEAEIAAKQVDDDVESYIAMRILGSNVVAKGIQISVLISCIVIWTIVGIKIYKGEHDA